MFNVYIPARIGFAVRRREYASPELFCLYNSAAPRASEDGGSINVNLTESRSNVLSETPTFLGGGGGSRNVEI